ncbi:tRNA (cytidine(34)-2'-O)-methyltransferase [Marinivivus vitaminiproducens]|uniref:tRNA (cytidine(34)-2'-O)-methyltransferase n=1 Tax=Marinivivus vitaminiproducens TaxID=3035935 RepID=UPI0027AA00A4|nr:TrmH family RNA methyltransferase [Geminicoccaceae bacterium SCSIO 64248]
MHQPDMAPNVGAAIRLAACLGIAVDLLEPFGFVYHPAKLRRIALDYLGHAAIRRHASFREFEAWRRTQGRRLVLLTTEAPCANTEAAYRADDVLMVGAEGSGVPREVHEAADLRVGIPMRPGLRSLNVVTAAAMVLGEALRQQR